jgi:hypothetical protein
MDKIYIKELFSKQKAPETYPKDDIITLRDIINKNAHIPINITPTTPTTYRFYTDSPTKDIHTEAELTRIIDTFTKVANSQEISSALYAQYERDLAALKTLPQGSTLYQIACNVLLEINNKHI